MLSQVRFDPHVLTATEEDSALSGAEWHRFAVLGDSIAEALLGDPYDGLERLGWPERTARALRRQQSDLTLLNLGRRYVTTREVRSTQLPEACLHRPDLAAVICGGNDVLAPDFDRAATARELLAIVDGLLEVGSDVALLTMFDACALLDLPHPYDKQIAERTSQLADELRAIAAARPLIFVDLFDHPRARDRVIYSADRLHANELGHAIVASEVIRSLAGHLRGHVSDWAVAAAGR